MRNKSRKGNAVFTVVTLVGLSGFSGLAIDASMLRVAHSQAQNAADVAAHSAVSVIDFDDEDTWRDALSMGLKIGHQNSVLDHKLTDGDIKLEVGEVDDWGNWLGMTDSPNAVRSSVNVADLDAIMAQLAFGVSSMNVSAVSGAKTSDEGGEVGVTTSGDCYLPLAIASCWFDGTHDLNQVEYLLQGANSDTIAWALPGNDHWMNGGGNIPVGSRNVRDQMESLANGTCGDGGQAEVGMRIGLNNGNMNSAIETLADLVDGSLTSPSTDEYPSAPASTDGWDAALWGAQPVQNHTSKVSPYGNVLYGTVVVFDGGGDYSCDEAAPTGSWNTDDKLIVGFARAAVYDVYKKGLSVRLEQTLDYEWGDLSEPDSFPELVKTNLTTTTRDADQVILVQMSK